MPFVQFQPVRALRAARELLANPDDLAQVFTIIESLSGDTLNRTTRRMHSHASGRRMLVARPDIVEILADRAALARLADGSLGRAYLDFVNRENISAEGIRAAALEGTENHEPLEAPYDWVYARLRDTHDLWHAATGYAGDLLGETALLGFIFAQTWNPAIALIIGLGFFKTTGAPDGGVEARRTIIDGFKRGMRAQWLPAQEWEELLALPVREVRERLSLGAPPVYTPVRNVALQAA